MSQKKNYLYKVERQSTADYFFLLGHCERMAILDTLGLNGATSFGELLANCPLSKSSLTQHLQILKRSSLIESCRVGKGSGYALNEEAIKYGLKQMRAYLKTLSLDAESAIAA